MIFVCWVVRIFLVIFMLYTNSFLIKQRRKEFGVYHMLGLEKKHLAITLFWESLSVLVIGLLAGILFGMLLDKLLYAVLIRMLGFSVPLGFFVSPLAIGHTVVLFAVIMALNYFYDIAQIHATSPIELLHGTDMGEKEPRAKWLLAILGFILLATGYTISLKIEDPVSALAFFFVAVLCVIFGTYLLFTAGSIALLKLLKKKKITVSTAESCTGGSIAARLTSIAGSSEYFNGSIVAYSNEVKMNLLYVSPETLERHGAVSEETVIEMVKGAMKALKTDCAVATSGIAGPGGGTPEKPVGTVWIAAGYKNEIRTYKQETNRGRAMNIERAGNNALLMLRDLLK